jgi:hypothetical protein
VCGGDGVRGGVDTVDVRLVDALDTHAILLDQPKGSFESLLFRVYILELVFCFSAFYALNLYHLVRLASN